MLKKRERLFSQNLLKPVSPVNREQTRQQGPAYKIGIVTNTFQSGYHGRLVDSAVKQLNSLGHCEIVQSNSRSREGELAAWESLLSVSCDGVILHTDRISDNELNNLMAQQANSVLMNRRLKSFETRSVYFDNEKGGALAASHLLDLGHRSVAMVTGPSSFFEVADRSKGFKDQLAAHSSEAKVAIEIESDFTAEGGALAMDNLTTLEEHVTAVFFQNDAMAIGAMDWCRRHGIRVPEDMSIIGFDDVPECLYSSPQLSSIRQPLAQIGRASVVRLLNLLGSPDSSEDIQNSQCFLPQLASRSSVAKLTDDHTNHQTKSSTLSIRERSCIYWAARGKTSWEISLILNLAESTVVFYLRNAGKKLRTVNRTHTVAAAIKLGVIS
ncbi:MAG: substrate-binding domain-containing protein [Granulosicoccus sp.]